MIIGQEHLTAQLSKIFQIFKGSKGVIRPHFILTGKSGNSKSYTIATLCRQYGIPCLDINAAQLTKEGTSGNSLSKALSPLLQHSDKLIVVFVDEWDKLFISGNSNDSVAHESTTGVQNEFLKVLESNSASVFGDYGKYVNTPVNKVLFVFAGAFNGEDNIDLDRLRTMGVKTEFLGRVGLIFNTNRLTLENLYEILDNSELLKSYCSLVDKVEIEPVKRIIKDYLKRNYEQNTLGARYINTLIHQYFISGGLKEEEVKNISFQDKITLK